MNDVNLSQLAEWSGEHLIRRYKFMVPVLKFNGSLGKWTLLSPDNEGNYIPSEIKGDLEVVILKTRRILYSFEKNPDGSGKRMFTNEHNSWKDVLTLFEMTRGESRARMVDAGLAKDLRQRWPKLRLKLNLYCLLRNQIVKLPVRGRSLSSLFRYFNAFGPNEHVFQYWTKLDSHIESNEGGLSFYVIDWTKSGEADLSLVAEKLKEVVSAITLQDKQYEEFGSEEIESIEKEVRPQEIEDLEEEVEKTEDDYEEEERLNLPI